jgi:hypothetical protein
VTATLAAPAFAMLQSTSLKLAGAGLLLVLAGLFFRAVYRAGASRARRRIAEKGIDHARDAQAIDEHVRGASDDRLHELYDKSLD